MKKLSIAEAFEQLLREPLPLRFTAYDGSASRSRGRAVQVPPAQRARAGLPAHRARRRPRLARAYVTGDLTLEGVHPGDPYEALVMLHKGLKFRMPTPAELVILLRSMGLSHLKPPPPPPQEAPSRMRRIFEGFRHSMGRDAEAIHHHYDVSNAFYELVLGPSMTYTCAVYPHRRRDAGGGAVREVRPGRPQARPAARPAAARRRLRLGRHGPPRRQGVRRQGARRHPVARAGDVGPGGDQASRASTTSPRCATSTTALVEEGGFDAVSLDRADRAHRGAQLPGVLRLPPRPAAPAGPAAQPLHHPPRQPVRQDTGRFIDRYIFPDGELIGSGRIISEVQNAGLEVQHEENFRVHYAKTLAAWCRQPRRPTGTSASPRSARAPPASGGSTWPGRGSASSATRSSSTTCSPTRTDDDGVDGFPLRHTF